MLFNSMLIHGISPYDLSSACMIPIPKNKRLQNSKSDNFRAICLQSALCKVLDVMVLNREVKSLKTSEMQFGFKKGHSAALATAVLLETVDYYVNGGSKVYGVALDATKAFDRVEYSCLFAMLVARGVNPLYVRLLYDLYVNQEMYVRYNSVTSNKFQPVNGVKQGGVLSPTLFAVYVNGMIEDLQSAEIGCHVGTKFCGLIGYADDIILLSPTQHGMDKMIRLCEDYARNVMVKFNGSKSKVIVFDKGKCDMKPVFTVDGQVLECVTKLDYLGYKLSGDRGDPHVQSVVDDLTCKFNAFIGDFQYVSSEVKGDLFLKYCSSLYGSHICMMNNDKFAKLNVTWRKAIRRIFMLPKLAHSRLLYAISGIPPVDMLVHKRFFKFYLKGASHANSVIKFMFNHVMNCKWLGRMGSNLLYLCQLYKIDYRNVHKMSYGSIAKKIDIAFTNTYSDEDHRLCSQIRDLIDIRDYDMEFQFILNNEQINDIIALLVTG